ncbi:MAG: hypothetical protein LBQ61_07950 [Spirochaetales bacterium]|jgi:hypothetical protein|nr:hypothetical protein [Spirochaetales bacterium]
MKKHPGIGSVVLGLFLSVLFPLGAEEIGLSLNSKTQADFFQGTGSASGFHYGAEEYANLRLRAPIRDQGVFYGAFNLTAAAGSSAAALAAAGHNAAGVNYAWAIELERLYLHLNGDALVWEAGLLRIPFGYSPAWGPADFLNPRNPLQPASRPRAALGTVLFAYPGPSTKLALYAAAPKEAAGTRGGGARFGLSAEGHTNWGSFQGLYFFEAPSSDYPRGLHRGGLSVKADWVLTFFAEALYQGNPENPDFAKNLAASLGADYSLPGGSVLLTAEYLYSGLLSSTAALGRGKNHYLNFTAVYLINDWAGLTFSCTAGLEDLSFLPTLAFSYELFQGLTFSLSALVPLDKKTFNSGNSAGELGPETLGRTFQVTAGAELRY